MIWVSTISKTDSVWFSNWYRCIISSSPVTQLPSWCCLRQNVWNNGMANYLSHSMLPTRHNMGLHYVPWRNYEGNNHQWGCLFAFYKKLASHCLGWLLLVVALNTKVPLSSYFDEHKVVWHKVFLKMGRHCGAWCLLPCQSPLSACKRVR